MAEYREMRRFIRRAPERILERDAGLVAINHDGAFDDLRFHGAPFELEADLASYRDSCRAKRKGQATFRARSVHRRLAPFLECSNI
jgi:hypothetical protein